jgi:hypothetical protein
MKEVDSRFVLLLQFIFILFIFFVFQKVTGYSLPVFFRQGGFNIPLKKTSNGGLERIRLIRCFNVLRQCYEEDDVPKVHATLGSFLLDGTIRNTLPVRFFFFFFFFFFFYFFYYYYYYYYYYYFFFFFFFFFFFLFLVCVC